MAQERDITTRRARVPDLLVEQLALGELAPDKAAKVRAQLEAEPGGFERLARIRRSNDEILLQHPPRQLVPQIQKRAGIKPAKQRSSWFYMLPMLAAGAAALALTLRHQSNATAPVTDVAGATQEKILTKGMPRLTIYKKTAQGTELLQPGAVVQPHDEVQIRYTRGEQKWRYGVVFSIDGRGSLTLHYPERAGMPQDLKDGEQHGKERDPGVSLAQSYELDDAPDFERFFFVASEEPIDINAILIGAKSMAAHHEAAAAGYLNLPPGQFSQWSMTLKKETP